MNEENKETSSHEESLATITKEILILKPNELVNPKSNDIKNPKMENMLLEIKDNFDKDDCVWGIKQSENKYKTVTIKNELYALNDCVCCRSGFELDYIAKIMKLSQENNQKVCTLRWFFRPFELPTTLEEVYKTTNTQELFLAFGEGIGVENKNPLGVITRKCKVLCIIKDDFNDLPSRENLDICDFFFEKAFNCDTLQIISLDGIVDAIGAQKVYDKKEWLNWNINNTLYPMKTFCQSYSSHTLLTNLNEVDISPFDHNSSSAITNQQTKNTLIKKRKRDSIEKIITSPKMMEKIKKIKCSTSSKKPKLSVIIDLTKHEDQAAKLKSDVKSIVTIIDAPKIETLSFESPLHIGFNIYEISKNEKLDESLKNYLDLSSNVPMILEQSTKESGKNVDNIHITCEEFPIESFLEPSKNLESSTNNFKKDENSLEFIVKENGISKIGEPLKSKKERVENKTTIDEEQKMTSKVIQNQKIKKSSHFIIDVADEKIIDINLVNYNVLKRPQNNIEKVKNEKIQEQILNTLHCDKFEKTCEDIVMEYENDESDSIEDQQSLGSPLATIKPIISCENITNKECIGTLQSIENIRSPNEHNIVVLLKQNIKTEYEDWNNENQMGITTKKILLLHNIDLELHSIELQESLSKFLDTKCQVQKIVPNSFYYATSIASALLEFPTQDIAQKSLQNLNKGCFIVGERTLIATLYEDLEFANKLHCFHGHICIHPKCEILENNHIELDSLPHVAQGNTIEFTYGLQWRLLQEQHELQWQLLNELHEKKLNLLSKDKNTNKLLKKSK